MLDTPCVRYTLCYILPVLDTPCVWYTLLPVVMNDLLSLANLLSDQFSVLSSDCLMTSSTQDRSGYRVQGGGYRVWVMGTGYG